MSVFLGIRVAKNAGLTIGQVESHCTGHAAQHSISPSDVSDSKTWYITNKGISMLGRRYRQGNCENFFFHKNTRVLHVENVNGATVAAGHT